jgi:hypothetical protein
VISRRFKLAWGAGGIVGAVLAFSFAPIVRYEAAEAGRRYGAVLAVEAVVPTLRGVRLQNVDVTLEDVPSARIHLDEIEVSYGSGGRKVALRGGVIAAVGARDVVLRQAEAWRSHHVAPATGASGGSSGGGLDLAGLRVSWASSVQNPVETASATDLHVVRSDGHIAISAGEATVSVGRNAVSVKEGRLELAHHEGGGYRVGVLSASEVNAQVVLPATKPAPEVPPSELERLPPPISAPTTKHRAGKGGGAKPAKVDIARATEPGAVAVPPAAPRLTGSEEAYRAAVVAAAHAVDLALEPDAKIHLGGVHARIHRGEDVLNLGPGVLQIARREGRLVVDLAPALRVPQSAGDAPPAPGVTPPVPSTAPAPAREEALTFRLAVPLGEAPEEIAADVDGGPIWLSSLGVHEGDFGLFDVGLASLTTHSHLVLTADGQTLRVDGDAKVHALSIKSRALSDEPVAGLEVALRLKGELDLDGYRARIAEGEVDLGAIRVIVKGEYDRSGEGRRFRGTFDMPITACQSMLDSTPKGLVPKLSGMRLAGSYALRGRADCDTANLDHGFVLDWDVANTCRVVEAPAAVSVERFRAPFSRTAYDSEGRPVPIETGPGTPDWVPLSAISKFMETAVLTTEDGGFLRHHGFDHEAIRNSFRENLRRKRFVRGASTISMQLAKNLYLDRGKNLSRKLQEAVLTMYLEQELTKEQILELYFNVVEFGPMIYGIGPAARYYFSGSARELSLGQALYISSIMPNPKIQHFGAGAAVAPAWMSYLRKLMKIARDRDHITDEELDEGLRETVLRGSPTPQRSARAITGPDPEIPPDGADEWPQ